MPFRVGQRLTLPAVSAVVVSIQRNGKVRIQRDTDIADDVSTVSPERLERWGVETEDDDADPFNDGDAFKYSDDHHNDRLRGGVRFRLGGRWHRPDGSVAKLEDEEVSRVLGGGLGDRLL